MLPSSQRISRTQFPALGKPVFIKHSVLCTIRAYRIGEKAISRAMVSVSKKEAKGAVDRNRLRRQYYTVLKTILLGYPKGSALQVIVKAESKKKTQQEIFQNLQNLLG
jgi:ribonuclease P protein component